MKIDGVEEKWSAYGYDIKVDIQTPEELYKLHNIQINGLHIERNFDLYHLPVIMLGVSLPKDWYYDIIRNPYESKFILKIEKYIDKGDGKKTNRSTYVSSKFSPILLDDTPFRDEKFYNLAKFGSGKKKGDIMPQDLKDNYTFILVRDNDLEMSKKKTNKIITSGNMLIAITKVLGDAGASNILISQLDNSESYKELLLLPIPTFDQLDYLNSYFGFYKEGAQIFFDLDGQGYFLKNTSQCTVWKAGDEFLNIIFTVNNIITGDDRARGVIVDGKSKLVYINVNEDQMEINNMASVVNHIQGNDTYLIHSNSTSNAEELSTGTTQLGSASQKVAITSSMNKFIQSELTLRAKEKECVVHLALTNIDLSWLVPNKEFKFITDITSIIDKLTGKFRLSAVTTEFIKDGDHFNDVSDVILMRTEK